jgi:hypothetical protein
VNKEVVIWDARTGGARFAALLAEREVACEKG